VKSTMESDRRSTALIGMHGVYTAAAELARRGFIVSPTSCSASGADLLVTDQRCRRGWSVQVKTTERRRPASYCLVGRHAKDFASGSHVYIFVSYKDDKPSFSRGAEPHSSQVRSTVGRLVSLRPRAREAQQGLSRRMGSIWASVGRSSSAQTPLAGRLGLGSRPLMSVGPRQ
jgi:hypothetical protein